MNQGRKSIDLTRHVQPGDVVAWNHGGAAPEALIAQLLDQRHNLAGRISVFFTGVGCTELVRPEHADAISFSSVGGLGLLSRLAKANCLDIVPCRFSDLPELLSKRQLRIDVYLARVSLPDGDGNVSLGATVAVARECMQAARLRIAEVNPHVPYIGGDALVPLSIFDQVVQSDGPLPETRASSSKPSAIALRICEQVASLIQDGATLQLGIGSISAVLPTLLRDRKHLGVHSGILTDGLMDLIECGAADGLHKEVDPGVAVAGELLGTSALYRFAHTNPKIALHRTSALLSHRTLSAFKQFVSVNGALEIDLSGQINAETANGVPLGAIGGQVDFVSAGAHSERGMSIIALASTTPHGHSRIVSSLDSGVVTTSRSEVDVIVTEYGIAHLRGRSLTERARALAAVAHPDHRDRLMHLGSTAAGGAPGRVLAMRVAPRSALSTEGSPAEAQRFVGRSAELSELRDAWHLAAAGAFRCVLLTGEPGAGKTRLASEVLASLEGPVTHLEARARRLGATASFGLWVDALERHLRTLPRERIAALCGRSVDDLASLLRTVAELRGRAPELEPPRPRLLGSLGGLLADLARANPVALVLNDVHLADPSSWEVLSYLADQFADAPVLVLATARDGELAEAPTALRTILDLEEMGVLSRLEVGPLDDHALTELAEDVMGGSVGKEFLDWLWDRSRGNPLYAGGLLRAARDEGVGRFSGGLHHLPEELTARVRLRVDQLDAEARSVLEILAVAGAPVELAHLVRFTGWTLDTLASVLDGLVRLRLVTEAERGHVPAYEISHPVIQETIYEHIGGARRFAVHRRVARNLLVMGRLGEAAGHFARSCEAGDAEAISVLVDALGQAEGRGAYQEALGILGILADLVPSGDTRWEEVGAALSPHADWVVDHRADADALRAVAALREIDAILTDSSDLPCRALVKSRLTSFLSWGTGELDAAAAAAEDAGRLHRQAGQDTQARLAELELAYARGLAGNIPALHAGAEVVLTEAQAAEDTEAALFALGIRGTSAFYQGHFSQADTDLRTSIALAKEHAKPYRVTWGLMCLGWSLGYEGRLAESYQTFQAAKATPGWRESNVLETESLIRWLAGDYLGSMQCSREVLMLNARRIGLRRAVGPICLALCGAETGALGEARRALEIGREIYGPGIWYLGTGLTRHAEGMLAWRDGNLSGAALLIDQAASELIDIGAPVIAAPALLDLAELAHERERPDACADIADKLWSIAEPINRRLYSGIAEIARSWAALATNSPSTAAEAAENALGHLTQLSYPLITARAQLTLGLARQGRDPELSIACLTEAAERFDQAGAIWRRDRVLHRLKTMGRAGRRAAGAAMGFRGLTSRELEIARLAAQRIRATDIGRRLGISRRTVEAHLANIYAKVGVNSRNELADALSDLAG